VPLLERLRCYTENPIAIVKRSIQGGQSLEKRGRNWLICAALVFSTILFMEMDTSACSLEDADAGLCDSNLLYSTCGMSSCLGSLIFAGMALMTKKEGNDKQVIVIQQQPPQQVIQVQQPAVQQPQPQYQPPPQRQFRSPPPPPAREAAKTQSAAGLRKQAHLERGHKLEMEGDLEGAIIAYELAEDFKEAQRVRWALGSSKGEGNNGPSNVNISIGKVGDTSVKDSVITGSDDEI